MTKFKVVINRTTYTNVYLMKGTYPNGGIGLFLMDDRGFLCMLTVSIDFLPVNTVALDIIELPEAEQIVKDLGIGKPTGCIRYEKPYEYPLYELDMDAVDKICRVKEAVYD